MPLSKSRRLRSLQLLTFLGLFYGSFSLNGQSPAAVPAQTAPASSAKPAQALSVLNERDLTKPQAQPDLSVDHDPILSPDPDVTDAVIPSPSTGNQAAGDTLKKEGDGFTLRRDVDEVLLNCTVVNEKGQLVRDLDKNDFQVWEDGVPQKVASFQHQDVPVSLGILVDNSGSMRDKRAAIRDAALHLVRESNPDDSAFVVNFADRAYIDQDFTSDAGALEKGLTRVDSRGGTALFDAVVASANEMTRHAKQQKQVLLIITDGEDNASRLSLQQAIRRVQDLQGPVVYTIGLLYEDLTKEEAQSARNELEALSLETGGVAYFPKSLADVDAVALQVASDIRNQYTLGYHSTKMASLGGYRSVRIEATAPKHGRLTVRTKKGYEARSVPPQTASAAH